MDPEDKKTDATNSNPEPISQEKYDQAIARAQSFEGKFVDLEKKYNADMGGFKSQMDILLKEAEEAKKSKALSSPEELESYKKDLTAQVRNEVQAELEEARGSADKHLRDLKVYKAQALLSQANILDGTAFKYLSSEIDAHTKLVDGDIVFTDKEGNPRYVEGNPAQPVTAKHFAEELAVNNPPFDIRHTKSGSMQNGRQTQATGGTATTLPANFDGLSKAEKQEWFTNNPDFKF